MNRKSVNSTKRSLIVFLGLVFPFTVAIILQLFYIQYLKGNEYRALAQKLSIKEFKVEANRGDILAEDGSVLATSVPKYDVFFDPTVAKKDLFYGQIGALSKKVSRITGEDASDFKRRMLHARKSGVQYVKVATKLSFSDYQKMKKFPIFKRGIYGGGFIAKYHTERSYPFGDILKRTIGFSRGAGNRAGIEGAYEAYLKGKDGMKKKQKIKAGVWRPLSDINDVDPENGKDVVTNINIDFQDVAHHRLKEQLKKYEADHGSVVIMDVKTGAVKAMVNLGKTASGDYRERRNYAVYETFEPGSTFKVFSIMSLLEDGLATPDTKVDTGEGVYEVYDKKVRDSHNGGFGELSLAEVLEKSSNVGIVKLVYENYKDHPKRFVKRMYGFGLHNPVEIDIKGEGKPYIPDPKNKKWSGLSLPWMAYGYGVELTALQLLTYYNGIANNGKVMKPYLVNSIREYNHTIKKYRPAVLNSSLASSKTLKEIREMLEGVVTRGTGVEYVKTPYFKIAGKTGTAQTEYWKGSKQYISSFVGYFPADNPQYSMIVVIHKPNPQKGYYGAQVAGSVFKQIAEFVYGKTPVEYEMALNEKIKKSNKADEILSKYKTIMPDLRGLSSKDALYILENMGLSVQLNGSGIVKEQSVPRGKKVKKNQLIRLKLS
jgi:cell division protein FtsI (penicillin-binding protein 3)